MIRRDERGFTLIELLVVTGIFLVVIIIAAKGFEVAAVQVGQQAKQTETQIGGVVGLELLRSDLQGAGYGLPTEFQTPLSVAKYTEITGSDSTLPVGASFWHPGQGPADFNDATGNVPRAVQNGNTAFNEYEGVGSQYLVIKSLSVAPGNTQKKWTTVTYDPAGHRNPIATWGRADRDLSAAEHVIVTRSVFSNGVPIRQLQVQAGSFSTTFGNYTTMTQPHTYGDVFQVYGVDPSADPRMPFNRADYYVRTPDKMPPACAPNTGILYKAVVKHGATGYTEIPLLDCVADMQVVYGLGPSGSTEVNNHPQPIPSPLAALSAADIRSQLKEIRVYILTHEGKMDNLFSYPSPTIPVGEDFGAGLVGRNFNLAKLIDPAHPDAYTHYRWKVYTIVVRPKNLIQ